MFDEKEFIAKIEESRREFERWSKDLISVRMKIGLEGFVSELDQFEISPELIIRRAPLEERKAFYSRSPNPKDLEIKAQENEFVIEYDFTIHRGSIHGLAPVDGIILISIFFTILGSDILNINKGNFYLVDGNDFRSAGFYTCPNEYRFVTQRTYDLENLEVLKTFWPQFKNQFENNFGFALVARRYYYSRLRLNLEDRMIDLMIALEALLVPETTGTKGDKISIRLAKMISTDFNYAEVQNLTADAYRMRNKIIHGGHNRFLEAFPTDELSSYCQAAIRTYLTNYSGLNSRQLIKRLTVIQK